MYRKISYFTTTHPTDKEEDHVLLAETFKEQHNWRNVQTYIP
jgi:hypothetical protein